MNIKSYLRAQNDMACASYVSGWTWLACAFIVFQIYNCSLIAKDFRSPFKSQTRPTHMCLCELQLFASARIIIASYVWSSSSSSASCLLLCLYTIQKSLCCQDVHMCMIDKMHNNITIVVVSSLERESICNVRDIRLRHMRVVFL